MISLLHARELEMAMLGNVVILKNFSTHTQDHGDA